MPWGWECRAKLLKQLPSKPTERKGKVSLEFENPAPNCYDTPELYCGNGYSHIKRSPAFTFGHNIPTKYGNSAISPSAPMLDICGKGHKGLYKVKHGIMSPPLELPREKVKMPGPCNYAPNISIRYKKAPIYSMRPAARPPYQPWDQWTPSPNMYLPYIPGKKRYPAYSFGNVAKADSTQKIPDPGAHDPNFNYVKRKQPAFSFGAPYRSLKPMKKPAPNAHCEKKVLEIKKLLKVAIILHFMYIKPTIPAPTFGIRHSPYLGVDAEYLKPENLKIVIS
ncbi:unnamed protein product [Danaus chrysippus]|uniref:(African queen) hypothetical protein n=1 Tax=Danaus chrysippus TaxID=151541 RepID=A0A8J2R5T9_9NEOP|nr:unnamed protein product [Danaus chrysippus]